MTDLLPIACCPTAANAPDLRPIEGEDADVELAALTKAVGHPVRVRILRLLGGNDGCVGELVELLPVAQSTVSQHLKILKDAGLVRGEVDGPRSSYCLDPRGVRRLRALTAAL